MDEINYRRLVRCPKTRCEQCGATAYQDPEGVHRCVVCDHARFEVCLDCGHLMGWCQCVAAEEAVPQRTSRRSKTGTGRSK